MTEVWDVVVVFLWMFGVPMAVWFLKDLQVERTRKRLFEQLGAAERRASRNLWMAIHFREALQMIASRAVEAPALALEALNAAARKEVL